MVRQYFKAGKLDTGTSGARRKDIDDAVHIVAQMGEEPFIEALNQGAQVILAGRAYDPYRAMPLAISKGLIKP